MTSLAADDDRAVLGDEEAASPPPSFESRSSAAVAVPNRRRPVAALLASLALALAVAALHRHGRQPAVASLPEDPAVVDAAPPVDAPTEHDDASSNANSHFVEAPRTVDYEPADMMQWSPFPVTSPEEHTLGYPFVAACITRTDEARSVALAMTGALDVMDAFPSEDDTEDNLFGQAAKTWTYVFLVHDAEDFEHLLSFGLPYVPDLIMTRDLQDSRIGIHHPHDEDSPGRRRLAKPTCADSCTKGGLSCAVCCAPGGDVGTCAAYEQNCGVCPEVYEGVGECAVVTPVNYNALFTAGETGTYDGISDYNCYRTVDGTNATTDDLVTTYPDLAEKIILKQYPTAENSDYLYVLKLTNTNFITSAVNPLYGEKGKVYVTCSIHSREFTPGEICTRFAEYLLQNYETDPDVHWILDWNEIHLVPTGNPDGRRYDEKNKDSWRKNRNLSPACSGVSFYGIDLNRNFPFKWNECESTQSCSRDTCVYETYRGDSEESEQETKAIVEYAKTLFPEAQRHGDGSLDAAEAAADVTPTSTAFNETNTGVFMDVHSYGGDIGFPWGYKEVRSGNDDGLGALGRKMASYNQYKLWAPEMPNFGYPTDGDTLDTMYGWLGVAAILWELGTSFYQSCTYFEDTIINQAFPGMLYAAKVAKSPFTTSKGPDILCLSLPAASAPVGSTLFATVDASDSVRAQHADDGNTLFATGSQGVEKIEVFVGCHPNEGATSCPPNVETFAAPEPTVTGVELTFDVPATAGTHTIYVRAVDSDGYAGPVTARSFVATACPTAGCTNAPTTSPTASPTTAPTPSGSVTGPGPGSTCESRGPVGCKVGESCNGQCRDCCCGFSGSGNSKTCNS